MKRRAVTLIELLVVIAIVTLLLGIMLPAVQMARESARRTQCRNNMKQIGIALASYESSIRAYPFGVGGAGPLEVGGGIGRWSAQSQLLPYLEQANVFDALNFDGVPWGHHPLWSPPNRSALGQTIRLFLCPSDSDAIVDSWNEYGMGKNSYRANAGTRPYNLKLDSADGTGRNDGAFWYQSAVSARDLSDGLSTTALFSERCLGNPNRPDPKGDYYLTLPSVADCLLAGASTHRRHVKLEEWSGQRWGDGNAFYTRYHHILAPNSVSCNFGVEDFDAQVIVTATSRHPSGVHMLTADGAVRFVRDTIAAHVWKSLGTIAAGEPINESDF